MVLGLAKCRLKAGSLLQEYQKYSPEAGRLQPSAEAEEVARSFNGLAEERGWGLPGDEWLDLVVHVDKWATWVCKVLA
jgi:hypothetical protein